MLKRYSSVILSILLVLSLLPAHTMAADSESYFTIAPKFEEAYPFGESDAADDGVAVVKYNGKYGMIDKTGEFTVQPIYEEQKVATPFSRFFKKDGQWGLYDLDGNELLAPSYAEIGDYSSDYGDGFSDGLIAVFDGQLWGYLNEAGTETIAPQYTAASSFVDGVALVAKENIEGETEQFFINKNGAVIATMPVDATYAFDITGNVFNEGMLWVLSTVNGGTEKAGVVDPKTGQYVVEPEYLPSASGDSGSNYFSEGFATVAKAPKEMFVINRDGDVVGALTQYENADYISASQAFSEGLTTVGVGQEQNFKKGYIDYTGKEAIAPLYDEAMNFSQGLARVSLNGKWGSINQAGEVVIPLEYDSIGDMSPDGLTMVEKDGKFAVIQENGTLVTEFKYDDLGPFYQGISAGLIGDKWVFVSASGHELMAPGFDEIYYTRYDNDFFNDKGITDFAAEFFPGDMGIVKQNGKFGYVSSIYTSSYTVTYASSTNGTISGSVTESVYYDQHPASIPSVTANSGYAFAGWSSDGGSTLLTRNQLSNIKVVADVSYTAYFKAQASSGGSGNGSSGGSNAGSNLSTETPAATLPPSQPDNGMQNVLVNIDSTQLKSVTAPNGQMVGEILLTSNELAKALEALKKSETPMVTILVNDYKSGVKVNLSYEVLAATQAITSDATFELQANGHSYQLRADEVDMDALSRELNTDKEKLTVSLTLTTPNANDSLKLNQDANAAGLTLVDDAIEFTLLVSTPERSVEIHQLKDYAVRSIQVNSEVVSSLLGAVVYTPATGQFAFVPHTVANGANGSRIVNIKSNHNSIYAVVAAEPKAFADLTQHWAKADIELLASKLVVSGVSETQFAPDKSITRAEFATLLVRALGLAMDSQAGATRFADVQPDAWYAGSVEAAVQAGLINGVSQESFAPNAQITREQIAVMLSKALAFAGKSTAQVDAQSELSAFSDQEQVSAWATDAIATVLNEGIMSGTSKTTLSPVGQATRAQAVVMLKRFLQAVAFID